MTTIKYEHYSMPLAVLVIESIDKGIATCYIAEPKNSLDDGQWLFPIEELVPLT